DLQAGLFLLDAVAGVVGETRARVPRLDAGAIRRTDGGRFWAGALALAAKPGAYTLAVEFEQKGTGALGVRRAPVAVPDYRGPGLRLSSVLPALLIEEADGPAGAGRLRRGPFVIQPAPEARFAVGE